MDNIFLITGNPKTGKTTLLKKIISKYDKRHFYGFITEEVKNSYNRTGFRCVTLNGKSDLIASVYRTNNKLGRYGVNIKSIERLTLDSLYCKTNKSSILIIDEIGPMQYLSEKYITAIDDLFHNNSQFIVGTIYIGTDNEKINSLKNKYCKNIHTLTNNNRVLIEELLTTKIDNYLNMKDLR